jgi:hypothetical protein
MSGERERERSVADDWRGRLRAMAEDSPSYRMLVRNVVRIDYTNHRGKRAYRLIVPRGIYFGLSEWHPEPQWLLDAHDFDKGKDRTFALAGIHGWEDSGLALSNPVILAPPVDTLADTPASGGEGETGQRMEQAP